MNIIKKLLCKWQMRQDGLYRKEKSQERFWYAEQEAWERIWQLRIKQEMARKTRELEERNQ